MDPLTLIFLLLLVVGVVLVVVAIRRQKPREKWEPAEDAPLNTLAVVAFVLAFFATIPSIVCGHIALRQVDAKREKGRGLAIAALAISYTLTALLLVVTPIALYYITQGTWQFS